MSTLIVIPARYASKRYPGKPLVKLRGASGKAKSLIRRSWDAAMKVKGVKRVVVATDDERIKHSAEAFGAEVVMTSGSCRNGTERCADVISRLVENYDIVANLQGDAPLTPPWFIEKLVDESNFDGVYTCGPEKMMYKTVQSAHSRGIFVQASLERMMKCGVGICGSCCVGEDLACKDGTIFDGNYLSKNKEFGHSHRNKAGILEDY